jgi:hypothetical protein
LENSSPARASEQAGGNYGMWRPSCKNELKRASGQRRILLYAKLRVSKVLVGQKDLIAGCLLVRHCVQLLPGLRFYG